MTQKQERTEFVAWCKKNGIDLQMTNNQSKIMDQILAIDLSAIGSFNHLFALVRQFHKDKRKES